MNVSIERLTHGYLGPDGEAIAVLDIPQLIIDSGAQMTIAGASGSGKTTLLHLIAGLLLPTSGTIALDGRPIGVMREVDRDRFRAAHIGVLFQTSHLLAGLTALENVLLPMGFATSVPPAKRRRRAADLLARVGLADRQDFLPAQLSGGQQQRVALARALANAPALLLADEPTAHVDRATAERLLALICETCVEHGTTLLLASHDPLVLERFPAAIALGGNDAILADRLA